MKYKFSTYPKPVKFIRTKFRNIKTSIPSPGTHKILSRLYSNESRSMQGQLPIVWKSAKDFTVYDVGNNKFIDFTSTIFVSNIGHSNKRLINHDLAQFTIFICFVLHEGGNGLQVRIYLLWTSSWFLAINQQ